MAEEPESSLEKGESMPVSVGEIVGGKYYVDKILGVGGMAIVAAATHEELQQPVALKVMRAPRKTKESVERFLSEARAAVRLKSVHVAKVIDVGTLESGLPFMVMELLEGEDLDAVLEKRGKLAVDETIDYILQACDAISEAHAAGIIHRDLKPANLFVTKRRDGAPLVKVLDFGISKQTLTSAEQAEREEKTRKAITHESIIMGSPAYMSPEQIQSSAKVDVRTDIWSLGVILFELLTGQQPFGADNPADIFVRVLNKPPPPLLKAREDVPSGLAAVVMKCLEKKREARYETLDAFANALSEFIGKRRDSEAPHWRDYVQVDVDLGSTPPPAETPADSMPAIETASKIKPPRVPSGMSAVDTFVLPGRKPRSKGWLVVLAALVAFGGVAWWKRGAITTLVDSGQTQPPAAAAAPPPPTPSTVVPSASAAIAAVTATAPPAPATADPPPAPTKRGRRGATRGTAAGATAEPTATPAPAPSPTTSPAESPSSKYRRTEW